MEQRPLRLGDIVDDYCPRERRITNHAIVALIGDTIRQTRCTTCESEHVYKEAKVPKRRKKNEAGALYEQVLAEVEPPARIAPVGSDDVDLDVDAPALVAAGSEEAGEAAVSEPEADQSPAGEIDANGEPGAPDDVWFGHRRLIRASLPKTDAEPQPRPIPEFTMHQRQTRGSQFFRHGQGGNPQNRNGFRPGRSGSHQGQNADQPGQGGRPHRGGRGRHRGNNKRSR